MDDSLNICLACGICCDGSLIGFVQIEQEEFSRVRKILDIEESDSIGFFLQPCTKFCNGCTIYEERPKQCGLFECKLLQSVDNKTLGFNSAVENVKIVKEKKLAIESTITELGIELKSPSFYFQIIELNKILQNKKADFTIKQIELSLISELEELNTLVYQGFGVKYF